MVYIERINRNIFKLLSVRKTVVSNYTNKQNKDKEKKR